MMQRYNNYCDSCLFLGQHQEFDVYICNIRHEYRTVLMRYGDQSGEYKSNCLFVCEELTDLDKFCLINGLELTEKEQERLLKTLCSMVRKKLTIEDYKKYGSSLVLGKGNVMFPDIF